MSSFFRDHWLNEDRPHPDNLPLGHKHIDLSPYRTVGMQKLYLDVDEVFCDYHGVLDRFSIVKFEPRSVHGSLTEKFEVNFLVIHSKDTRQFFFIKNAKCMLINVNAEVKADSSEPLFYTAHYNITFDYKTDYFWNDREKSNAVWFDTGIRDMMSGIGLAEGQRLSDLALKHWAPNHLFAGRGNHEILEPDDGKMFHRESFELQQGPLRTTTWIDENLQDSNGYITRDWKEMPLQTEDPHNKHESNFFDELHLNNWTMIRPNGLDEPTSYKHLPTGITATSRDIKKKIEKVRRKQERIKKRNQKLLEEYFKRSKKFRERAIG
jgi:hypothetical protein